MGTDIEQLVAEGHGWVSYMAVADHPVSAQDTIHRLADALEREHQRAEESPFVSKRLYSDLMAERDAAVQRAESLSSELAEAHTHFAIQEGRIREAVQQAERAKAANARNVQAHMHEVARRLEAKAAIREALEWGENVLPMDDALALRGILSAALRDTEKGDAS